MSARPTLAALLLLAFAAALLPLQAAAGPAPVAVFTIVDGDATVVREAGKFPAVEGLQARLDDIVHTGDKARLVRLEFADGSVLDLGAATHLMLRAAPHATAPPGVAAMKPVPRRAAQAYVSQGWTKVTPPVGGAPASLALASRQLDLPWLIGTVVMQTTAEDAVVFVEAGSVTLTELRSRPRTHALVTGQLFSNRGGEPLLSPRPVPQLLAGMPRAFADSLPPRAAKFAQLQVEPAAPADISYDDVAEWINAERKLRLPLRDRWAAKAQDPAFRNRLVAELSQHPEWDRLLFPEKYAPRPAQGARAASSPGAIAPAAASAPVPGPASAPGMATGTPS